MEFLAWQERWIWDTWGTINGCQWLDRMSTGKVFGSHPFQIFHVEFLGFATYILKIILRKYGPHTSGLGDCLNSLEQIKQDLISSQMSLGPAHANNKTNPNNNTPHTFSTFLCLCHPLQPPTKTTELDTWIGWLYGWDPSTNNKFGEYFFQKERKQSYRGEKRTRTMDWQVPGSPLVHLRLSEQWSLGTIPNCLR